MATTAMVRQRRCAVRRLSRTGRALNTVVGVVLLVLLGSAGTASAHATLLFASPDPDSGVTSSPTELRLTFDSPVTLPPDALRVTSASGRSEPLGAVLPSSDRRAMGAALKTPIGVGVYTVTWQVIAADGDAVTGSFRFAVGPAAVTLGGSTTTAAAPGALETATARWLLFGALAAVAGSAVMPLLARRAVVDADAPRRRPATTTAACLVGVLAALWLLALQLGAGSTLHGIGRPIDALSTFSARTVAAEAAAFLVAGAGVLLRRRVLLGCALLTVIGAEAVRAHPHEYGSVLGLATTMVHLGAVALWIGALTHTIVFALRHRDEPKSARRLWRAYARMAAVLLSAVLVSGLTAALIVVPLSDLVGTGYGRLLLAKTALVAIGVGLAAIARWRLQRGRPVYPLVRIEASVLGVVLAGSATLTALAPPRAGTGGLLAPPPATGPVVAVGSRAGQIGVDVQASSGQLVIHLAAPGSGATADDGGQGSSDAAATVVADTPRVRYRLAAASADAAGTARPLKLRGCGEGCFVSPMNWTTGDNILTLTVGADTWAGGKAAVTVQWPPNAGSTELTRLVSDLTATERLTVYEQVSSDTTVAPATSPPLTLTGRDFLNAEPYGSGQAPQAAVIPSPGTGSTLLLGYPAEHIAVRLVLDTAGRLVRETLTDPNHLTTRTFEYAETEK